MKRNLPVAACAIIIAMTISTSISPVKAQNMEAVIGTQAIDDTTETLNTIPGTHIANLMVTITKEPGKDQRSCWSTTTRQTIVARQGWSGVSSYIAPENPDIETMFLPYLDQLIILYNLGGVYYPAEGVNTLISWNPQSGYVVKFSQETGIEFTGEVVENGTLNLVPGWNLVPVLSTCPVNIAELFSGLDLELIKEVAGYRLFWPGMDISTLTELVPGSAYFVMMNSPGVITFPDCIPWQCGDPLTDIRDGKTYTTVQIGSQCWMAENLNVGMMVESTYSDVKHSEATNNGTIEKYCYDNDPAKCDEYGGLYDWDEMMDYITTSGVQGICPYGGWHIPTDEEMMTLVDFVGGQGVAGGAMKETGLEHWAPENVGATNSSGFTALPAGLRYYYGNFSDLTYESYFYTSSLYAPDRAYFYWLNYNVPGIFRNYTLGRQSGFSVRCLRDNSVRTTPILILNP